MNDFTKESYLLLHEARKNTIEDYDDGEETIEVCDHCYRIVMKAHL